MMQSFSFHFETLKKEYIDNKKSTRQIAREYDCSQPTVWRRLIKYNIARRPSYISSVNEDRDISVINEILEGELLGDGSLRTAKPSWNAYFRYHTKSEEYLKYLIGLLSSILEFGKVYRRFTGYTKNSKIKFSYLVESKRYLSLTKLYRKWYRDNKKIIPKDLKLTPIICKHWYIGDGYLDKRAGITLCTDCFSKQELETILIPQLAKFEAHLIRTHKTKYRIYIPKKMVKRFLEYIGRCPISCYNYKWGNELWLT